ncbi:MAG: hypothetical protein HOP17_02125 [Acidobacteria bacterium]|nr:hypothetical protein [Acidobacteriota bacterium]
MQPKTIPEPWLSFLREIDAFVDERTQFHCLGGFVVTVVYGLERPTSDLDTLPLVGHPLELFEFAGIGSELFHRYDLYLDRVGVATLPENYEERLSEVFAGTFERLQIFVLDPYDLALATIERNGDTDREDVKYLARVVPFDLEILKQRYHNELRIYLGNPEREDLTLKLWLEMISELQA